MKTLGDLTGLVGLDRTNKVPGVGLLAQLLNFSSPFLDVVLTKIRDSQLRQRQNIGDITGFAHGKQFYTAGVPSELPLRLFNLHA